MAGTLWPASLTWRKNSRPLVPELKLLVQDDQLDPSLGDLLEPFLGRRGRDHRVTGPLEPKLLQPGDARVILHEQDRCPGLRLHGWLVSSRLCYDCVSGMRTTWRNKPSRLIASTNAW